MLPTEELQQQGTAPAMPVAALRPFEGSKSQYDELMAQSKLYQYRLDFTKEFVEPEAILSIEGCCVASRGNISAIVGEAKSKKTFLCSALIASMLAFDRGVPFSNVTRSPLQRVVWFDTEQSELHVRRVADRIHRIMGFRPTENYPSDVRINYYTLRELAPKERFELLLEALELIHPSVVVIDGIADLQRNTNDLEESDWLVGRLMALSTIYNCHIINVLHTNPGSDKARGHLGSSLQRKCETVIYVHRVGESSVVEPQYCRNEPFDRFAFTVDEEALPRLCALPDGGGCQNDELITLLREEYGGAVERTVLTHKLEERTGLSRSAIGMRLSRALRSGRLVADGNLVRIP